MRKSKALIEGKNPVNHILESWKSTGDKPPMNQWGWSLQSLDVNRWILNPCHLTATTTSTILGEMARALRHFPFKKAWLNAKVDQLLEMVIAMELGDELILCIDWSHGRKG